MNTSTPTRLVRIASSIAASVLVTFGGLHLIASCALPGDTDGAVTLVAAASAASARR
jgi:hypothetical protein